MVTTSRADLSGAMWAFKGHGKTHEALFGREHLAGFRWLHERYRFAGLAPAERLPVARLLGETPVVMVSRHSDPARP